MTDHEKDQVLDCVKYHMSRELRRIVMTEVPQAYNAWMGRPGPVVQIVRVVRTSDGTPIAGQSGEAV